MPYRADSFLKILSFFFYTLQELGTKLFTSILAWQIILSSLKMLKKHYIFIKKNSCLSTYEFLFTVSLFFSTVFPQTLHYFWILSSLFLCFTGVRNNIFQHNCFKVFVLIWLKWKRITWFNCEFIYFNN